MIVIAIFSAILLVSTAFAQQCNEPKLIDIKTFSTKDTNLNSETTYAVEFKAQCAQNTKNVVFFTEINGKYLASSCDESGERYQISWTESNTAARSEEVKVKIYDEETFSALKKAQRTNADTSKIKEVKTISFYHTGAYKGPSIQIELVVTVVFGAIFYWALATRSKLQA